MLKQSVVIASLIFLGCNSSETNHASVTPTLTDSSSVITTQLNQAELEQQIVVASQQKAVTLDSLELILFWKNCIEPVAELDEQRLRQVVHFPLDGDWGYMVGLKNPKSSWTESDFYGSLETLFYKEFRDSLKHQSYKDVHVYQQEDGEINLLVQVNFVKVVDDFKYESSRILRYRKINDRWMLYVIFEAG